MQVGSESTAAQSESPQTRLCRGKGSPRLFIREMVMRNFKSYAGEQRVGPFHKVRVFHSFQCTALRRSFLSHALTLSRTLFLFQ